MRIPFLVEAAVQAEREGKAANKVMERPEKDGAQAKAPAAVAKDTRPAKADAAPPEADAPPRPAPAAGAPALDSAQPSERNRGAAQGGPVL